MSNQERHVMMLLNILHRKNKEFTLKYNEMQLDIIEWSDNKVVLINDVIWHNGNIIEDINKVIEQIGADI